MDSAGHNWLVWQLIDSAFPAGNLGHSGGLEAAWHMGELSSPGDVEMFLQQSLEQQGASMLPFVRESMEASFPARTLDDLCHVFLSNPVANKASRLQGQAFLTASLRCLNLAPPESLEGALTSDRGGHLPPVFGWVMRSCDIPYETAGPMYLFTQLRGWISAAVRLNRVGPYEGQALQRRLSEEAHRTWLRCRDLELDEIAQTSPLPEIWQTHHSRLYSRLFQS